MEIICSLLVDDVHVLHHQYHRILPWCTHFQIDIQDGVYVPSTTITTVSLVSWAESLTGELATGSPTPTIDVHLQIATYDSALADMTHLATLMPVRHIIAHMNCPQAPTGLSVCPSLCPEDGVSPQSTFMGQSLLTYPLIQIMTIHPGVQGQDFIPSQLDKIRILRSLGYSGKIILDGGIDMHSIEMILDAPPAYWPDGVSIGSHFSHAVDEEVGPRFVALRELIDSRSR